VSDVAQFRKNLTKLASAPENAIEVTSMAEVNQKFKEIAGQLTQSNFVQTISLKIPGQVNGTLIRFTFDNVSDAAKSQLYIEGTFNLDNFSLENVKYVGMTSKSGDIIKGNVDGIFVTFTFQGVRTDTNKLIDKQFADEWTYITSNGKWQINSEFDKKEDSEVVTERSSAVIMLVLDCSSSLASDFPKAQSNAKDFIDTLYKAVGGVTDPNNPEDPNNPDDPEESLTIYSTTPIDLSIAVFHTELKKRYYLTLDQYSSANLKDFYVEGLTVCSAMGNFIISPKELQFHSTSAWLAEELYDGYLPTKTQGSIIVARWSDINQALDKAGFSKLYDDITYICGERATDNEDEYIHYGFKKVSNSYNLTVTWGFVRGVRDVSQPSVMWSHPDNFKLAVMKDGAIEYIDDPNTDLSQFDSVLGISYIQIHEKEVQNLIFLGLENAQSGPLNYEMAEGLYGDVMPTYTESVLIQNFRIEFNSAISKFGGNQLDTTTNYWIRISDGDYAGVIYYLD
ncbi:MAG: hypothetical protein K2G64_06500, partial [Muribaculaceae bacterium]|nr:hypothetical protein [Muribaculaceae bacterium]